MKKNSAVMRFTATVFVIITILSMTRSMSFALAASGGAMLSTDNGSEYYSSAAAAWSAASELKKDVTLKLLGDWTADEDGNMGTGEGFEDGAVLIKNKENKIVIDLNGYSINRGLKKAVGNGSVFIINNCEKVKIINSSEADSVISGGNSSGSGGAAYISGASVDFEGITFRNNAASCRGGVAYITRCDTSDGSRISKVKFDNCLLTGNKASSGGAIYMNCLNKLRIFDTEITGNYAQRDAGVHTEVMLLDVSTITLGGKVIIADNFTEEDGTGLMLDESFFRKVYVRYDSSRPLDESSRIVVLSKTDDKTLRITGDSSKHYFDCYEYENDEYEIVKKGSGNDKYLDIKKA